MNLKNKPVSLASPLTFPLLLIAVATFLAMAIVFHPKAGWNVNTRLNLVFAIVEERRLAIDSFHDLGPYYTGDKAFFGGHYFSDKTFGMSIPAIPFYQALVWINGGPLTHAAAHYWLTVVSAAIPSAVAAGLFFLILAKTGTPPKRAVVLTFFTVFGTMWAGYGMIYMPYVFAFATLLGALYLILFPPARRITFANTIGTGLLAGYGVFSDLIFMPVAGILSVVWFARLIDQCGLFPFQAFADTVGERIRVREIFAYWAVYTISFVLPITLFIAYCFAIFGKFALPYQFEVNEEFHEGMSQGLFGITIPDWRVVPFITVLPYRGLFFWSPILILALVGCVVGLRAYGKRRLLGFLGLFFFGTYLWVNASYYMWWGGWSMGPRHLLPAIPFMALGLGELARTDRLNFLPRIPWLQKSAWPAVVLLGGISVALSLPLSLVDPQIPQGGTTEQINAQLEGNPLPIPQFAALHVFYQGHITIWPNERVRGVIGSERVLWNVAGLLIYAGLIGGLYLAAYRRAPVEMKEALRLDYPTNTIDGRAAFIPGRR